jgi:DNA-binding GntR family transcriptional regulator
MTFAATLDLLKRQSLPTLVLDELEHMIRDGRLKPGDPLRETTLSSQLGVSRGPIREAFRALAEKGLVRVEKNRGVFVRAITPHEADAIYEVRLALEQLIIMKLAQMPLRVSTSHLAALLLDAQGRAARSDYAGCHALNVEFHETLARLTGNAALLDTYQRLVSELSLFRQQAHASSRNALSLQRSVADHLAIYEALVAGDGALAWSVLQPHVEASRQRLQTLLNDEPERLT